MIRVTLSNGTVNEYLEGITVEEVVTDDLGRRHGCRPPPSMGPLRILERNCMRIVSSKASMARRTKECMYSGIRPLISSHMP